MNLQALIIPHEPPGRDGETSPFELQGALNGTCKRHRLILGVKGSRVLGFSGLGSGVGFRV